MQKKAETGNFSGKKEPEAEKRTAQRPAKAHPDPGRPTLRQRPERHPTPKQVRGDWGEDRACGYLRKEGYRILCRKYRCRCGEIDIIAVKKDVLAFVEVKTRSSEAFGLPCQAVNAGKQKRLKLTGEFYLLCNPWAQKLQPHWDIVEVLCLAEGTYIRHLENAF